MEGLRRFRQPPVVSGSRESRSILARRSLNPSVWVFPSDRKSSAHIGRLNGAHDNVCAETKKQHPLHFVLYDWRHTLSTEMAQAGVDLVTLAAILGYSSLRVVQKYVHPTADHKRQAMRTFEDALTVAGDSLVKPAGKTIN